MRPDGYCRARPDWEHGLPPRADHEIPTAEKADALHRLQLGVIAVQSGSRGLPRFMSAKPANNQQECTVL
jgi:hypothetical protein